MVAMLSVENVFYTPRERQEEAAKVRAVFASPLGDHVTLLNVYVSWKEASMSALFFFF